MVSLEAVREALVDLDYSIDRVEDCISDNAHDIYENDHGISDNDKGIDYNDQEIDDQRYRLKRLQKDCRYCDDRLWEDRDALVLYCQQFAFAKDMVGPCAEILTCRGTDLPYRWTNWVGGYSEPVHTIVHQGDFHEGHGDYHGAHHH